MRNMTNRNKWKKAGALVLVAAALGSTQVLSGSGLITGCAAGKETPLGSYTEAEMLCFGDNVLEYWEIQGLVENYNPSYLKQLEVFNGNPNGSSGLSKDQLLMMAEEFRWEAKELKSEADDRKDSISEDAYQEYQDNIKTLKRYAKELESDAKGTPTTKRALRIVRNQLVVEISAKMRDYQSMIAQDSIVQKKLELAELAYASAERQFQLGMYSGEELLAAEDARNAARTSADSSTVALIQSRQDLIMALGWDYTGNPEILAVPEPDVTKIASYNLETDMELAAGANYDVIDLRNTDKSEFNSTTDKKRQIREKEDQVRMQMEYLYKDVMQKELSYNTAQDGWTVAENNKAQEDRKYQLGMISKAEHLSAEITWLTAKASKEQAAMDLLAAMEAYEWAILGLVSL